MDVQKKESAHVHRYTSYLKDLEKTWAYVETDKKPKSIYTSNIAKKSKK